MAYQNLTLRNIAGEITAQFNDGTFRSLTPPDPSSGETAAFIGTASSGVTHEFFRHVDMGRTFTEFGADSEIARMVQAAKASDESLPVIVSRVGARNASMTLKRAIANSHELENILRIVPKFVQEAGDRGRKETLSALKMILMPYVEGSFVRQRVLLGLESASGVVAPVYDSERLLVADGESVFDVEMNLPVGEVLYTDLGLAQSVKDSVLLDIVGGVNDGWKDLANASERIEKLSLLNEVVNFEWENAQYLSNASWDDEIYLLKIYGTASQDDLATESNFEQHLILGKANKTISNKSQRYTNVDLAYQNLQFEDVGYIYCEGCHADTECVELDDLVDSDLFTQLQWPNQMLGNLWKLEYNGQEYSYMFGHRNPFKSSNVSDVDITVTDGNSVDHTLSISTSADQRKLGDLLNLVVVTLHPSAGASLEVESFANDKGLIECHVTFDGDAIASKELHTPFCNITFPAVAFDNTKAVSFRLRPSLVGTTSTLRAQLIAEEAGLSDFDKRNDDPFVMTHYDLTGQFVPEGVIEKLLSFEEILSGVEEVDAGDAGHSAQPARLIASDDQVREISFLQQAAQAAYSASTNYSQCIAVVPTSAPSNSDRGLQNWAGQPATYEVNSQGELKVKEDGTGILGMKLLAGHSSYREGNAFGGIMLTEGNNLPNEKPYGIDDSDEAKDAYGEPIDLGKHVLVVGAYGITPDPEAVLNRRRANQSGGVYTNAGPKICGILNSLAPGNEPIGQVNGRVTGMIPRHRTSMATLNNLALVRVCMIDQNSVISSIYTAAQPNSDYRKISSIMSSNAILKQLRSIAMPYVGRPFKDEEIASLTQTIDGAMKQMVSQNFAQSINVSLSASRLDRINGVLRASVRFVPPLSIEAITVEITLEPPAAGL